MATATFIILSALALGSYFTLPGAKSTIDKSANTAKTYVTSGKQACINGNAAIRRTGGQADDANCKGS